ncbi:YxD-tail cyclophane-containing RiPP peptide [Streptomyces sp. NPDC050636]|uniref:YxD-tail cyclophane-containing RiPP peptide n=1 Tax=Streptomyces sp. NPDC050636 TaxID=3154510 RepID=UPI003412A55B
MDQQTFPEADRVSHDETVGPRGNDVPLRDYTGVDLQNLAARTTHPVLRDVLARLAARTGSPGDIVAYYEDSAGEPPTVTQA